MWVERRAWALATAMTILAPSFAMPPASYFLPTMNPWPHGRHSISLVIVCWQHNGMREGTQRAHSMSKVSRTKDGAQFTHHDVLEEEQRDAPLSAELHKVRA